MTILTDDENTLYYVVRVNGVDVSKKVTSPMLAEMEMQKLDESQRSLAEVVPVTANGSQMLLG